MDRQASIEVGPYALDIGSEGGTTVRAEGGGAEAEAEALRQALDEPAPSAEAPEPEPDTATEIDEAAEATAKVEQAVALCKGVTEGRALDPAQLGLEVGSLLDCLERLDRKKQHKKALRMARALATLLMLLKRWADLLQTLRIALRAGEQLGDLEAVGWARHELGSLRLAAGDVEGADRDLRQAREVREEIGDRRGLAATNRNLNALCNRLRSMLRNEELVRRGSRGRRPSLRYLLAGAALAAFLFGGGVAAGTIVSGGNQENVADEGVPAGKSSGSSGDLGGDGNNKAAGGGSGSTSVGGRTDTGTSTSGTTKQELEELKAEEQKQGELEELEAEEEELEEREQEQREAEQREAEEREARERESAERGLKEQAQREAKEAGPELH